GDYLLVAVGRGPNTSGLGYEEQGIEMDRGFVLANKETLETNVPGVYAVGDIVPGLQLAHRGFAQGIYVAERIAGLNPAPIVESGIERITYCEPELGSVGLSEKQAKEQLGDDAVEVYEYNLGGNGKSQILGTTGFIKLVREKDGPIIGVHMIGSRTSELMGEALLIVNWEAYPEDAASLIHGHPSQREALGEAALALAGKPLPAHAWASLPRRREPVSATVKLPPLGESVTERSVTRWLKGVGDTVDVDEPLREVSTDKVDTEIPSPVAGTIEEILVEEDEDAEVGADLVVIGDGSGSESSGSDDSGAEAPAEQEAPAQGEDLASDETVAPSTDEETPSGESEEPAASESGSSGGAASGEDVTMPALGESVTEGTVTRWLKE